MKHAVHLIAGSDWVIDISPGAGEESGRLVAARMAPVGALGSSTGGDWFYAYQAITREGSSRDSTA